MNPFAKRAESEVPAFDEPETLELTQELSIEPTFDQDRWSESREEARGAGGRQVLGGGLAVLAALWLAYTAWSAGRALVGQPLSSPAIAQWIAIAAGPLALMGLAWLMFGRTRRKEAERFTRSVVAMRTEAQSLEALLEVLSQRITDSRSELTMITQHLMQLGDEAQCLGREDLLLPVDRLAGHSDVHHGITTSLEAGALGQRVLSVLGRRAGRPRRRPAQRPGRRRTGRCSWR